MTQTLLCLTHSTLSNIMTLLSSLSLKAEYSLCYQLLARHHALYSSEKEEECDYENPPVQESLYQNVDFRKLKESDAQSMASEC